MIRVFIDKKSDATFILEYPANRAEIILSDKFGNKVNVNRYEEMPIDLRVFIELLHKEFILLE
jgi:hypothetical protein